MRIGGGTDGRSWESPEEWAMLIREMGYRAVYAPIDFHADRELRRAYKETARVNDLVIGEVGAWTNPLDPEHGKENIEYCRQQLELAEELEARCCVNIAGCLGEVWDGAYESNYSEDVYAQIVDSIREIIDGVHPKKTFYTIEPMAWMVPDSPESYLKLLKDVDRKEFAVHLDCTNMISSPERCLHHGKFIETCFQLLGPYIKSVHAKDIRMENKLPCHIYEVMPGKGIIDFRRFFQLCRKVNPDLTVYSEHLKSWKEYQTAVTYLKRAAE